MGSRKNEMKIHAHDRRGGYDRGQWATILAGLAATFLAALPALGGAGTPPPPPGDNGGGSHFSSGDETIGTLPAMGGGRIDLPFVRGWRGVTPAFSLEGSAADLSLVVRSARGRGFVTHESVEPRTGRIRLAFHGDVLVALDRELAQSLAVDLGLAVPASFGEGRMHVTWRNGPSQSAPILPGVLPLPLGSGSATPDTVPLPARIRTGNSAGARTSHTILHGDGVLILRQTD
jgi:hypothetical protein